jgi:cytochrome c oxidase subunit III
MRASNCLPAEQFDSLAHQEEAATVGMWVFLATEVLFFGGLFTAYTIYRTTYPDLFARASEHSNLLLGTINTAVLLTSSLFMVFAVHAAKAGRKGPALGFLGLTILLALAFLSLKGVEYSQHISEGLLPGTRFRTDLPRQLELFFWLYFVMTGLHALHVLIGIGVLSVISIMILFTNRCTEHSHRAEIAGLYWHFVDVVWVFLYPLFYLVHQ